MFVALPLGAVAISFAFASCLTTGSIAAGAPGADMIAGRLFAQRIVRSPSSTVQSFLGRTLRDQAIAAAANQVAPAGLLQCSANVEIILRLEKLHQRSL